ncbi:MAG: DUF262 domain-containing protein [Candidatus Competibacteraceae bacterium]|nr:DUF262 domain-containing protein [Candidatus Competibacteraceae bacterium]
MKNAELTPAAQKIDRIIKRIDDGDIKIPAFQRGFVWKQNQVIDLLESIVNEYPIGSVLLWKSSERLKSTRNIAGYEIPEKDTTYPVNYTLDGQQRMASIYGVFSQLIEQEDDHGNYNPNLDIFEIYYDFENKKFIGKAEIAQENKTIHLRKLLNVTTLITALGILNKEYHSAAQELASQFLNYEIPVVTIENRSREDVGIIFERINNTGTRLSALDLMTAWTWTDDFHLVEESNTLREELEEKNFGGIHYKTLLQIISGVIQETTITKNVLKLSGDQVRDNWDRVRECLRKAIDFLATDVNCRHIDFLPYHQQLIGIAKFFDVVKHPDANYLESIRKWFWKTSFSTRYSTGQTNAKMDADIENIILLSKDSLIGLNEYRHSVTVPMLKSTKFSKSNPLTRAFLLLMAQCNPIDLVKNQKVDIGKSLSQYNRKEFHHVFPQAFLKSRGVSQEKIFGILNFCFLSSESNKVISKKSPSDYFFNLVPKNEFHKILGSNMLPVATEIYKDDNFEDFIDKRANFVISELDKITA